MRRLTLPNVTWLEPQILTDLLALNIYAAENGLSVGGERRVALVSPWLSDIEMTLGPSVWHQYLNLGRFHAPLRMRDALTRLVQTGWVVDIAVLKYGESSCGLVKDPNKFHHEREFLKQCFINHVRVRLCSNLHAKGVVSPLGIITGGTNYTRSGLYLQAQNSNYFSHDHIEFAANRKQLLSYCDNTDKLESLNILRI